MEIEPTPWILSLSIIISFLIYLAIARKNSSHKSRLPPGPTPLPLVGSLFELGDQPHRSLASLANSHGPVMALKLGTITTIVISSPESAKEALQTKDHSLSFRSVPNAIQALGYPQASVIWMDPTSSWKNLRTIIKTHLFNPQTLDANRSLRHRKVHELIAHLRGRIGHPADIGRAAFGTSLNLMSNTLFSVDLVDLNSDSAQEFKDLVWALMEEVGSPNISDFFPLLGVVDLQGRRRVVTKHLKKLYQVFDQMIESRLEDDSNCTTTNRDFLDVLLRFLHQENESKLDRHTIKSLLTDIFVAGSETTSNTVEWAMAELLRNPISMAKARAELAAAIVPGREVEESDISDLPFLQAVVKETFRLHPPGPLLLPHKAEKSVELRGYTVPKHSRVLVNVWAMGRDPHVWENPESFVPERFLGSEVDFRGRHFELIPFGSGRRLCPGLPLAHRMVHLMLASLVHSFDWGLPDGMEPTDVDVTEKFGITLALAVPVPAIPLPVKYEQFNL